MSKAPAFQFYTGDWRKSPKVQCLDHEHKGVWIDLIVIMWDTPEKGRLVLHDGSPMPDVAIARNLGIPEAEWKQKRSTLLGYGTASEDERGVFYCRRMVRDEAARVAKAEAGRLGGLVKQTPSKSEANEGSTARKMKNEVEVEVEEEELKEKDEFQEFWKEYPKRAGGNPKKPAFTRWRNAVKHDDFATVLDGVKRYAAYCLATDKTGTEYVMQATTFLGDREGWTEDWIVTESDRAKVEEVHPSVEFNRKWKAREEALEAEDAGALEPVGGLTAEIMRRISA